MTVARHASTTSMETDEGAGRTLIRWSAVFAGTLLGLAALALLSSRWCLLTLWALYLSFATIGQDFLSFQWDNLLLESGALAGR